MNQNLDNCPECGEKLKSGVFSSNALLGDEECNFISEMLETPKRQFCQKCGTPLYERAVSLFNQQKSKIQKDLKEYIGSIPIITTPSPHKWDYTILGMASGQSTSGTGLFAEFKAGWTDFLGVQSSTYNKKIAEGEFLSAKQLQVKAAQMGGNAVIGVDIDYSELGVEKGMVMVCMAGTVIRLHNPEVLEPARRENIEKISGLSAMITAWSEKYPKVIKKIGNVPL